MAYPIRLPIDKRRCIARSTISSTETMPPSGSVGSCGRARGCARGINSDRAVVNVAVQEASPVAAPDVGVQVAAASGFLMTLLYVVLSIFPVIDVKNAASFTAKVSGIVIGLNAAGALYFWRASKRREALTAIL